MSKRAVPECLADNLDIVWTIVTEELPALSKHIHKILSKC